MERKNTCTVILYYETEWHADTSESKNFHHLAHRLLLCLSLSLTTNSPCSLHTQSLLPLLHCRDLLRNNEQKKNCE